MKRKAIQDIDLDSFKSRLAAESDRAAAVLGASLLDARLEGLFRNKLANNHNDLLGRYGPLQTFASRITLALALCWIDEDTAHDLNVIRDIRNDFAHHLDHDLKFAAQSVVDRCKTLRSSIAHVAGYSEAAKQNPNFSPLIFEAMKEKISTPRWRYQFAVESIDYILAAVSDPITATYSGPSLTSACFDASARIKIKIQATATSTLATDQHNSESP